LIFGASMLLTGQQKVYPVVTNSSKITNVFCLLTFITLAGNTNQVSCKSVHM